MTEYKGALFIAVVGATIALAVYPMLDRVEGIHGDPAASPAPAPAAPTFPPSGTTSPPATPGLPEQSNDTDADVAENTARQGLAVAFTWYPGIDTNANDAYTRARPWLTSSLAARMLVAAHTERGPSVQWGQWASEKARVVADVSIGCSGCPPDTDTVIHRVAAIQQTAIAADHTEPVDPDTTVWVTVTKDNGDSGRWFIDDIHY